MNRVVERRENPRKLKITPPPRKVSFAPADCFGIDVHTFELRIGKDLTRMPEYSAAPASEVQNPLQTLHRNSYGAQMLLDQHRATGADAVELSYRKRFADAEPQQCRRNRMASAARHPVGKPASHNQLQPEEKVIGTACQRC